MTGLSRQEIERVEREIGAVTLAAFARRCGVSRDAVRYALEGRARPATVVMVRGELARMGGESHAPS